jgi:hypothetical protein
MPLLRARYNSERGLTETGLVHDLADS